MSCVERAFTAVLLEPKGMIILRGCGDGQAIPEGFEKLHSEITI